MPIKLPYETISNSTLQTEKTAQRLAEYYLFNKERFNDKALFAFFGNLGAGKTAFIRGFVNSLQKDTHVNSPTYAIVNEYAQNIYHYDMYRVESEDDLIGIGYFEMLNSPHVTFIEWSENILPYLPQNYVKVQIFTIDEKTRRINISLSRDS